jgi:biotin synthase
MKAGMLGELKRAGADMCGVAVDCATRELFQAMRGRAAGGHHDWDRYWDAVQEAGQVFGPGKAGVHLIVGLGETEAQIIGAIQRAHNLGANTHLFSFFPEAGSLLAGWGAPPIGQYRRVQLARYLIDAGRSREEQMSFTDSGQLTGFGVESGIVNEVVLEGTPFMTSGCTGKNGQVACNRPYGNERPSQPLRNFPFHPQDVDIEDIRRQLWSV